MTPRRKHRDAPDGAVPAEPSVLELRVHGVDNTPPHVMLEVAAGDIEQSRGDSLGSFWQLTDDAVAHGRAVPPTHHDHVPSGVRREAYSWGSMARFTPAAPGGFGRALVQAASRAGWLLLLPLGLANVAYWSRAIPGPGARGRGARSVRVFSLGLSLLTVTAVATVSLDMIGTQCFRDDGGTTVVACDVLPEQLRWLVGFTWPERLVLLSLAPLAALLFLQWLASASRMRYEHSTAEPGGPAPAGRAAAGRRGPLGRSLRRGLAAEPPRRDPPVLGRPGLWSRWVLARTMANLHVAAGLALVVGTLAWTQVYAAFDACHDARSFFSDPACSPGRAGALAQSPLFAGLLVASIVVAAVATARVAAARAEDMPATGAAAQPTTAAAEAARGAVPAARVRTATLGSRLVLGAAVVLFAGCSVALWVAAVPGSQPTNLLGIVATPALLAAVMFAIALAGLGWRRAALSFLWVGLAVVGLGALAVESLRDPLVPAAGWFPLDPLPVALAALIALVVVSVRPFARRAATGPRWQEQAWAGAAPGVFLLLSLGSAMMLTGLFVVAVGDWLNGTATARCLAVGPARSPVAGCESTVEGAAQVVIPSTYTEFAVATVVAVLVVLALVLVTVLLGVTLAWWRGADGGIPPAPVGEPSGPLTAAAVADADVLHPAGRLADLVRRRDVVAAIAGARRLAALSHRMEPVLAFIAVGFVAALIVTLFSTVDGDGPGWELPGALVGLGLWATALLWTALLVRVVVGSEDTVGRPLAIIWDLIGFLPRSAHPFGPPCYAERAVPELAARMDSWLRGDDLPTRPANRTRAEAEVVAARRVVLSAHSHGAVLAVAALFAGDTSGDGASAEGAGRRGRVGYVSYGSQLRPYFGRIFPELLGPAVLGTAPCRGPATLRLDPWCRELADPPPEAVPAMAGPGPGVPWYAPAPDTLVRRLGGEPGRPPAWTNLWRRSDFIGFPAASFGNNVVDRPAEEVDATAFVARVATHSGYPRSPAYRRALAEVLARLG